MPFSPGQKIFAILFVIGFTLLMITAYRKDLATSKFHYKNVWKILIGLAIVISLLVWIINRTR